MSHDAAKPIECALFSGKTTPLLKWRLNKLITAGAADMKTSHSEQPALP